MKKILGHIRKACKEYRMTEDGDVIAVGLSGGKDSLALLKGLCAYRGFSPESFTVKAVTVDMRFGGEDSDLSALTALCESLGVPHTIIKTDIAQVVFDIRQEKNPCSLCSRMRRGALLGAAGEMGCNKLALGHSADDALETFFLNLFYAGRIDCFSPVTAYPDRGITLIRPLILAPEKDIVSCVRRNGLTSSAQSCPMDKHTRREEIKQWLGDREKRDKGFKDRVFGAIMRNGRETKLL